MAAALSLYAMHPLIIKPLVFPFFIPEFYFAEDGNIVFFFLHEAPYKRHIAVKLRSNVTAIVHGVFLVVAQVFTVDDFFFFVCEW